MSPVAAEQLAAIARKNACSFNVGNRLLALQQKRRLEEAGYIDLANTVVFPK